MRVLGIETSCDDTAVGVVTLRHDTMKVEGRVTASQILTHRRYGGVVPEVAAREHAVTILPTIVAALRSAHVHWKNIDAIAVTAGPGLNTALLVGVEMARVLSYVHHKPLVRVNHIEGHILSNFMGRKIRDVRWPALALIVSGGHTELILVKKIGDYRLLGATIDDAVGEAFDKTAKVLGLPYPGGPEISRRALRGRSDAFAFPRAVLRGAPLHFSYSGLKTAVLYAAQGRRRTTSLVNDLCASFQAAAIEPLVTKTRLAIKQTGAKTLLLGGGVAANTALRQQLMAMMAKEFPQRQYLQPSLELCTDNGVMIAIAGAFRAQKKDFTPWQKLQADPNWELVPRGRKNGYPG